ncbi:hypothetical protein CC78DRAFT_534257 [Lojkania enalia]|uniref:Uncharacterized protein n=1 Tax=Lojkania enalia TaxID=147567 RepID=A0A9P4N7W2_9PLEO|nr:hypothetical protein CC78DRAFT_534257 [Didymosphaeria enalia]
MNPLAHGGSSRLASALGGALLTPMLITLLHDSVELAVRASRGRKRLSLFPGPGRHSATHAIGTAGPRPEHRGAWLHFTAWVFAYWYRLFPNRALRCDRKSNCIPLSRAWGIPK